MDTGILAAPYDNPRPGLTVLRPLMCAVSAKADALNKRGPSAAIYEETP
jgi:hypothetical protein